MFGLIIKFDSDDTAVIILYNSIHGAVVHSGERFLCKEEVRGSNPLGST